MSFRFTRQSRKFLAPPQHPIFFTHDLKHGYFWAPCSPKSQSFCFSALHMFTAWDFSLAIHFGWFLYLFNDEKCQNNQLLAHTGKFVLLGIQSGLWKNLISISSAKKTQWTKKKNTVELEKLKNEIKVDCFALNKPVILWKLKLCFYYKFLTNITGHFYVGPFFFVLYYYFQSSKVTTMLVLFVHLNNPVWPDNGAFSLKTCSVSVHSQMHVFCLSRNSMVHKLLRYYRFIICLVYSGTF